MNVKTVEPIGSKFCVEPHITQGKVNVPSKLENKILKNSFWIVLNAPVQKEKSAKIWKLFKMADFQSNS